MNRFSIRVTGIVSEAALHGQVIRMKPQSRGLVATVAAASLLVTPLSMAAAGESPSPRPQLAPLLVTPNAPVIPGRFIVVLDPGSTTAQVGSVSALATSAGGTVGFTYDASIRGFAASLAPAALRAVRGAAGVSYVVPDSWASVPRGERPSRVSPATSEDHAIWNLDRIDQRDLPLNKTYTYSASGKGVTAYVIDTGVWFRHPEFQGRARSGYDFVDDDRNAKDCNGHGTHVAGTISGKKYGVAKNIEVVALRVLGCDGRGPFSQVIAGVDWVTRHADYPAVANVSIGGRPNQAVDDAITASIESGITYTIAAGNDHADACNYSPARTPLALTVGASDKTDQQWRHSNVGRCLDLYAPGVMIRSAWPSNTGITNTISGTSFAAPHVAGTAALYLQVHPRAAPAQVSDAILGGATKGRLSGLDGDSPDKLVYTGIG